MASQKITCDAASRRAVMALQQLFHIFADNICFNVKLVAHAQIF